MTTVTSAQSPLLFNALLANAVFSSACGLLMSLFADTIVGWLGNGIAEQIRSIGIGLLVFAGWLVLICSRQRVTTLEAWAIVIGDALWVLLSAVLLVTRYQNFNTLGVLLIGAIAIVVFLFALLQTNGIRQSA